jgi:hypothetical protein
MSTAGRAPVDALGTPALGRGCRGKCRLRRYGNRNRTATAFAAEDAEDAEANFHRELQLQELLEKPSPLKLAVAVPSASSGPSASSAVKAVAVAYQRDGANPRHPRGAGRFQPTNRPLFEPVP